MLRRTPRPGTGCDEGSDGRRSRPGPSDEPPAPGGDPRLQRLVAQGLAGPPAGSVEQVVERLLGVQAQDERGFRLAVRSRTANLVADDVDRALTERRTVGGDLAATRHAAPGPVRRTTGGCIPSPPRGSWPATTGDCGSWGWTRSRSNGVSTSSSAPWSRGTADPPQLRDHLDAAGVPTAGQALIHLVAAASLRGLVVRGPIVDGEHAYVSTPEWLGPAPTPLERPEALGQAGPPLPARSRPGLGPRPGQVVRASPSATPGSASGR